MKAVRAEEELVSGIERMLREPVFFKDVLVRFSATEYRAILRAWSDVRSKHQLSRDEAGRYWISRS